MGFEGEKVSKVDQHGQAVSSNINFARNRNKTLGELVGFLNGLISDNIVNEKDCVYLSAWLREEEGVLGDLEIYRQLNSVVNRFLTCFEVTNELSDRTISELKPILTRIKELYGSDFNITDKAIGVLRGISADDRVSSGEIGALKDWLKAHEKIKSIFPFRDIAEKLDELISTDSVSSKQKQDLLVLLKKAVGNEFYETGSAKTISTSLPFDDCEEIDFNQKLVCFSGKFISGTRKYCEEKAIINGARVQKRVVIGLDFLIIGDDVSRDWKHTSYGNKILKAIEFNDNGSFIKIISESDFVENTKVQIVETHEIKETRLKQTPESYFKDWAFGIGDHYWDILGIKSREWIDFVKAKPLREKRKLELLQLDPSLSPKKAQSIAVKEIRPKTRGWAIAEPLRSDFSEGYLFEHRVERYFLQIFGFDGDLLILLFFNPETSRYTRLVEASFKELLSFLEAGDQSSLKDRDPDRLPESDMKYEIKRSLLES